MPLWNVPAYTQRTPDVCWEACGRMLWDWRYRADPEMKSKYALKVRGIVNIVRRLSYAEVDIVYRRLGLRGLKNPQGQNVRHALTWTPVIVISVYPNLKHARVISGHINGRYSVIDPCGQNNGVKCLGVTESEMAAFVIDSRLGDFMWYW